LEGDQGSDRGIKGEDGRKTQKGMNVKHRADLTPIKGPGKRGGKKKKRTEKRKGVKGKRGHD